MNGAPDVNRVLAFAQIVLQLREEIPFSVTSWGRTAKRNRTVGGVPNSAHLDWTALDAVTDDPSWHPALAARARGLGLVAIDEGDHVHLMLPRVDTAA